MALTEVEMPADVYCACMAHALSVEEEEVMGLLIGKFEADTARITSTIVLQRSDKRKDRVEISTEQLHGAMMKTAKLSDTLNEPINVLGWYHSHPHITVQPSHVDLRTQASYQMMDRRFVGIIFSVFNEDKNKAQEIQVTCFQATTAGGYEKVKVPLVITPVRSLSDPCAESIYQLQDILMQEDLTNYTQISQTQDTDRLTQLQNDSAFVSSQCHILKTIVNPLMLSSELKIKERMRKCRELEAEKKRLTQQLQAQHALTRNLLEL